MIKKLVTTFVKYPFYANLIIAILIMAGGFSLMNMKKSFFPARSTTGYHARRRGHQGHRWYQVD